MRAQGESEDNEQGMAIGIASILGRQKRERSTDKASLTTELNVISTDVLQMQEVALASLTVGVRQYVTEAVSEPALSGYA